MGQRDEAAEWTTESHLQEDPLAVAEEPLESDQRSERAPIHGGALEYADCPIVQLTICNLNHAQIHD
jgi:hypothetical protein